MVLYGIAEKTPFETFILKNVEIIFIILSWKQIITATGQMFNLQ